MAKFAGAVLLVLLAASGLAVGKKDDSLQDLMTRADAANANQQPDLCMEVARRALDAGNDAYKAGNYNEFRTSLDQVQKYSEKAHAAAISSRKHLKSTEIKIRKVAERLKDVKSNVSYQDQPAVQGVIDKLEIFRTELLHSMFGSKNND
jgi:glutaredoxin 2